MCKEFYFLTLQVSGTALLWWQVSFKIFGTKGGEIGGGEINIVAGEEDRSNKRVYVIELGREHSLY